MMRPFLFGLALLGAGCSSDSEAVAENAGAMTPVETEEEPGDWSSLDLLVGRDPGSSGLLINSPVTVDLNARLGPDSGPFRAAMADATPLVRDGPVLVSVARAGNAYLILQPNDHALEAGLKGPGGWRTWITPGAAIPRPAVVARLRSGETQPST